ncbi:MAG: hypothetical protein JRD89_03445 [Deltaproteobacteria bacterium]|nr:hypothetical protein [Deltaproteobacteria bacterium]
MNEAETIAGKLTKQQKRALREVAVPGSGCASHRFKQLESKGLVARTYGTTRREVWGKPVGPVIVLGVLTRLGAAVHAALTVREQ